MKNLKSIVLASSMLLSVFSNTVFAEELASSNTDNIETKKEQNDILRSKKAKEVLEQENDMLVVKYKKKVEKEYVEPEKNYSGWGISFGYLSATGLSYRRFFSDNLGMKATGSAFMQSGKGYGTFGMEGMYVHSEDEMFRFYSLAGLSYFGSNNGSTLSLSTTTYPDNNQNQPVVFEQSLGIGGGIGLEIGRKESALSMSIEWPITFIFKNFNRLDSILPIPQVSFMYNF